MKYKFPTLIFVCVILAASSHFVLAQSRLIEAQQYSSSNIDGEKYEFVKTYIMGLEYLYRNDNDKKRSNVLSDEKLEDRLLLSNERDRLVQANVNLRIARNLLDRFENSQNGLMIKIVKIFSDFVDEQTSFNNEERALLNILYEASITQSVTPEEKKQYTEDLVKINKRRKESSMKLFEASALINKALVSHEYNSAGEFYKLGITKDERSRLMSRLSVFRGEGYRGEPRAGQTFLEASISSIRELLEDPSWQTL